MVPIYPVVEDLDVPPPRVSHIRTTAWGIAWPLDAPAFCGMRPQQAWHRAREPATCTECIQRAQTGGQLVKETAKSVASR